MNRSGYVVIVDTSVFLNLLGVPQHNDHRDIVLCEFEEFLEADANLLLPIATVFQTGNHIADLTNGRHRRRYATVFCERVDEALNHKAPWVLVPPPDETQLARWLATYPDSAMQGIGLSNLSLKRLWESHCRKLPNARIRIWSRNQDLAACDRTP